MNPQINIELFLSFKNNPECLNLDSDMLNSIIDSFTNNEYRNKKYKIQVKKTKNIFKNPKIRLIKDKINNKVNLILNKLTENNIENLVFEFVENIKISNIDDYNEFLKTIYYKILSEINFIKIYMEFLITITEIYRSVYDFNLEFFYDLIENKFKLDYESVIDDNFIFLTELEDDNKRINNIILINELIKLDYFDSKFKDYIENYLLNQKKYLADISIWFKHNKLNNDQINTIKNIIITTENFRDKILLENLINSSSNKIVFKKKNTIQDFTQTKKMTYQSDSPKEYKKQNNVELSNILEEYLFIDNSESIENYIEINCADAYTKNKFCEFIVGEGFKLTNEEYKKILSLLKMLIKKRILFKSNLSRGLLNIYANRTINSDKLKNFLLFLKGLGITKSLEYLMQKHSIDI
jgi:hypothetical protein